jgi:hypothetical protein
MGTELDVEMHATIDATVRFGPLEHETDLHIRITEEGWELIDPDEQAARIEQEIRERFGDPEAEVEG